MIRVYDVCEFGRCIYLNGELYAYYLQTIQ